MQLEELKNIWSEYDNSIDKRITISYEFLKGISLQKTRSILFPFMFSCTIEIIFNVLFLTPVIHFSINYMGDLRFFIPAVILGAVIILTILWNVYSLVIMTTVHLQAPIITIQKKLQKLFVQNNYRQTTLLYVLYPIIQTALFILFCKSFLQLNLYEYPKFLVAQFIVSLAIIPLIIWIYKLSPDRSIPNAVSFLNEIKKFETER